MPCWHLYLEVRVETGSHIITQAWPGICSSPPASVSPVLELQVGSTIALLPVDISISTCVEIDFSSFTLSCLFVSDTGTKGCLEKSLGSFLVGGVFLSLSPPHNSSQDPRGASLEFGKTAVVRPRP